MGEPAYERYLERVRAANDVPVSYDEWRFPPYPLLRCPECRVLFSDHAIHLCASPAPQPESQAAPTAGPPDRQSG